MNQPAAQIGVKCEAKSMLRTLSATFTTPHVFLGELLQNALRAKATSVAVTFEDGVLTFVDDGCGVQDFGKLLSIAESGWEADTQERVGAYGMGFFAAIFACKRVEVTSSGFYFDATTADILDLQPTTLAPVANEGITTIRLHGCSLGDVANVEHHLAMLVSGFPLPVSFNGDRLQRPCELNPATMIETDIGWVSEKLMFVNARYNVFLQGLPIKAGDWIRSLWDYSNADTAVHLDERQFKGRMPDRDILLNPKVALEKIDAGINRARQKWLTGKAATMTPEVFMATYGDAALRLGMYDLLNAIDCVPANWLSEFEDVPSAPTYSDDDYLTDVKGYVLTRDALLQRPVVVDHYQDETLMAGSLWMYLSKAVLWEGARNKHWLYDLATSLDSDAITFEFEDVVCTGSEVINYAKHKIVVVRELRIRNPDAGKGFDGWYDAPHFHDERVLYLRDSESLDSMQTIKAALLHVTGYMNDEDEMDERTYDDDAERLRALIQSLKLKDAAPMLKALIANGMPTGAVPDGVRGKTFEVTFAADGQMLVAERLAA